LDALQVNSQVVAQQHVQLVLLVITVLRLLNSELHALQVFIVLQDQSDL
jgi:hypothetical protein